MQKQYNQTLFVEVPKGTHEFELGIGWAEPDIPFFISYELNGVEIETKLPEGEWEIVNLLNEITEEQAATIVEKEPKLGFKDYMDDEAFFLSAKNSLSSLATHLGFEKDANIIVLQKKN